MRHAPALTRQTLALLLRKPDRFWSKVQKGGPDDCWPWISRKGRSYGRIVVCRTDCQAHRVAFVMECRDLNAGEVVCHRCDNGLCVNPRHLFAGTQAENMADMRTKGRDVPARGERVAQGKLTAEDVRAIRAMAGTQSIRAIGRHFGVAHTSVIRVLSGHHWSHLP